MAIFSAVLITSGVNSGSTEIQNSAGASVSLDTLNSGDELIVTSGATVSGLTITGQEQILSGGSATAAMINSGDPGIVYVGGSTSNDIINAGGSETIGIYGSATNETINSGGTIMVDERKREDWSKAEGKLQSVYVASGGEIILSGFTGTDDGGNITGSMTAVGDGAYTLTIDKNERPIWSTTLTGLYSSESVTATGSAESPLITLDFGTGTNGITCFLEGTLVRGATVEKSVEDLRPGDMVDTLVNGKIVQKPIKWIGKRSVTASQMPEDDAYPIRIRANAFGPDVPKRDLLMTPEHCVFVDNHLIPARMLVNGGSIIVDRTISSYTFYHVELEQHGILLAEGLATESYLDTGNRSNFTNTDVPAIRPDLDINAGHAKWETDAAAALAVDRAFVEPVWQRLAARAEKLGFSIHSMPVDTVEDHDLRLITDGGWEIRPARHVGDRYSFMVPDSVNTLRLLSRVARPSDLIGPFVNDRRKLGVRVGEIQLLEGRQRTSINSHLGATSLRGWHAMESAGDTSRWTAGDAELPVALGNGPTLVEIQIVAGGPYLPETEAAPATALAG